MTGLNKLIIVLLALPVLFVSCRQQLSELTDAWPLLAGFAIFCAIVSLLVVAIAKIGEVAVKEVRKKNKK